MNKAALVSLSIACGGCTGWAFALAVDLSRTPPAELVIPAAPPPRARVALPGLEPSPKEGASTNATVPEAETEKVEEEDEGGCG